MVSLYQQYALLVYPFRRFVYQSVPCDSSLTSSQAPLSFISILLWYFCHQLFFYFFFF
ncbi:BgTH12-07014 [Blumeria graminis f. sp. triticale]|uniref:BgTH12-07014 n=1 Tax=Blumeria graminis f. sp. triticale TaxID=1689686 RepID=A0A9W4D8G5_BLUGR|nr:BgTH12-07014 [Blumeria graminis f. sp. triticale]